jgi:hypothetical protein
MEESQFPKDYRNYVATSEAHVAEGLSKLALLTRTYAKAALSGDENIRTKLLFQRKRNADRLEKEVLASQVRPQAELAFREKNYREAALLYLRIRNQLTAAEKKKLEFSERHM